MTYLRQPSNRGVCGQTCVAMIAEVSLEAAIKASGETCGTHATHIVKAFNRLCIKCDQKLTRIKKNGRKPDLCMVVLHLEDGEKHWTIFVRVEDKLEAYIDPVAGVLRGYREGIMETSYLQIYDKDLTLDEFKRVYYDAKYHTEDGIV